jgi:hypothetical protein
MCNVYRSIVINGRGKNMTSTLPSPNALSPPTVSNASVQVAPVSAQRGGLYIFNPSSTVTLWVSPLGTPASVGGPGSIAIQPLQGMMFGPPTNMPPWTNGMNAIASAVGANQICLLEFYQ